MMRSAAITLLLAAVAPTAQAANLACVTSASVKAWQPEQYTPASGCNSMAAGATCPIACATGWTGSSATWTCPTVADNAVNADTGLIGVLPTPTGTLPTCVEFRVRSTVEVTATAAFAHALSSKAASGTNSAERVLLESGLKDLVVAKFALAAQSLTAGAVVVYVLVEKRRRLQAPATNLVRLKINVNCADNTKCGNILATVNTLAASSTLLPAFATSVVDTVNLGEFKAGRGEPIDVSTDAKRALRITEVQTSLDISVAKNGEALVGVKSSTATSNPKPGPVSGSSVYFSAAGSMSVRSPCTRACMAESTETRL